MRELTRRDMLATAAVAGGVLTSASIATAQTSELVLVPDLQDRPLEGFVTQLDPASAQVHGHFPERSVQRDGGIEPYTARGPC